MVLQSRGLSLAVLGFVHISVALLLTNGKLVISPEKLELTRVETATEHWNKLNVQDPARSFHWEKLKTEPATVSLVS